MALTWLRLQPLGAEPVKGCQQAAFEAGPAAFDGLGTRAYQLWAIRRGSERGGPQCFSYFWMSSASRSSRPMRMHTSLTEDN